MPPAACPLGRLSPSASSRVPLHRRALPSRALPTRRRPTPRSTPRPTATTEYSNSAASGLAPPRPTRRAQKVAANSAVNLVIPSGSLIGIPYVIGEPLQQAHTDIKNAGLTSVIVPMTVSSPSEVGLIVKEQPGGGQSVKPGCLVTLYVVVSLRTRPRRRPPRPRRPPRRTSHAPRRRLDRPGPAIPRAQRVGHRPRQGPRGQYPRAPWQPKRRLGDKGQGRTTPKGREAHGPLHPADARCRSSGARCRDPWLLLGLLVLGVLVIVLNYIGALPHSPANWYTLGALPAIMAGGLMSTRYR